MRHEQAPYTNITLEREKRIEEAPLSKTDSKKVDEIGQLGTTAGVEIADVKMLLSCLGKTIASMQKGGRCLKSVNMFPACARSYVQRTPCARSHRSL